MVTGGAGFLGRVLVAKLKSRGAGEILIPLQGDFDLTTEEAVARMYDTIKPEVVFHLAAEVGGIGANLKNPGRYFYANMAMARVLNQMQRHGHICKKVTTRIFHVCTNATNFSRQMKNRVWPHDVVHAGNSDFVG